MVSSSHVNSTQTYSGLYSDGQTAAAHEVHVQFTKTGLDIRTADNDLLTHWPYDKLISSDPLTPAHSGQIGCKTFSGARLYVDHVDFNKALIAQAPQLSRKAEFKRVFIPVFGLALILLAALALLFFNDFSPARTIAYMIPDETRKTIGKNAFYRFTTPDKLCTKEASLAVLEKMLKRLNAAVPQGAEFDVKISKIDIVNAFAAPGEQIVMSGKLIKFAKAPEEIAAVLAHEMGHGLERHPETVIVRGLGINVLLLLLTGASPGNLEQLGGFLLQLKYIRDAEREADAHALKILEKAEISAQPMIDFFVRIEQKYRRRKISAGSTSDEQKTENNQISNLPNILSTHPPTAERIAAVKAKTAWSAKPLLNEQEWQTLRKICD